MGGGDLNLKKSWHPSTMKNMEKVWKAEQEKDQERKKIAQLKREIAIEKDKEDLKKYAMEQKVIEKKDDKKLDWMYKKPNELVNREEYLLGRPIDKSFEQMVQTQKDADLNRVPKNHVEYECVPPSLRFFSGNEQVDLARKMQEDPLYAIKKKEMETRSQLLKNPVKLKKLKKMLEQQTKKEAKQKSKKKKTEKGTDNTDDDELDNLLAAKYKQLKNKIGEKDLLKSMKKIKHKKRKKCKNVSSDSDTDSDSSNGSDNSTEKLVKMMKRKNHKRSRSTSNSSSNSSCSNSSSTSDAETPSKKKKKNFKEKTSKGSYNRKCKSNEEDGEKLIKKRNSAYVDNTRFDRKHGKEREYIHSKNRAYNGKNGNRDNKYKDRSRTRDYDNYRNKHRNTTDKSSDVTVGTKYSAKSASSYKRVDEKKYEQKSDARKVRLTEEEKERRRQEMMANAAWRDKEREKNVKKYREQENKELLASNKEYNEDFMRKQLLIASEAETIESRIKSNINNIQRSGRAMDANFAKR